MFLSSDLLNTFSHNAGGVNNGVKTAYIKGNLDGKKKKKNSTESANLFS